MGLLRVILTVLIQTDTIEFLPQQETEARDAQLKGYGGANKRAIQILQTALAPENTIRIREKAMSMTSAKGWGFKHYILH